MPKRKKTKSKRIKLKTKSVSSHPWSPAKQEISNNYKTEAETSGKATDEQWARYFLNDVLEFNQLLIRVGGEQHDFNNIFLTSYQQCVNNLNAGQPREEAVKDLNDLLNHIKPIDAWQAR